MDVKENTEGNPQLVEYRLGQIEKGLAEVKAILEKSQNMNMNLVRDVADTAKKQDELIQAINSHEKRIKALEEAPIKAKADRWQQIVDLVFKIAVSVAVVGTFAKIGIDAHVGA